MYCVEVAEYNKRSWKTFNHSVTFKTREEAMDYADSLKDDNVGVWLIEYELDENGDWVENSTTCLQLIWPELIWKAS